MRDSIARKYIYFVCFVAVFFPNHEITRTADRRVTANNFGRLNLLISDEES
jgi:hypothetical protein